MLLINGGAGVCNAVYVDDVVDGDVAAPRPRRRRTARRS